MNVLDTPSRKQKWRRHLNLGGQFARASAGFALPGLVTMAASTVFPPAGIIVPLAFMVGSHISLGYKVHQQKMVLDDNDDFISLSGALKVGIREKFERLTESGNVLLGLGGLAQQEREKAELSGEKISRVSSYLRAGKKNIGHVALIGGSVLALGLKLAGFGGDGFDSVTPEPTSEPQPDPAPVKEEPVPPEPDKPEAEKTENPPAPSTGVEQVPVSEDNTAAEQSGPTEDEMRSAIIDAGMPVVEGMDLDLQYRLAELLPTLEGMSDESRQYFEELYDRMDSDDPFVQSQAVKDYADLVLNCLGSVEGLDNKSLAFEMISEAAILAEDTNCQVLDFKGYMLLHGIGTDADPGAAVEILMTSLIEHGSAESARLLSYIYEAGLVDPADHPGLAEMHAAMEQTQAEEAIQTPPQTQTTETTEDNGDLSYDQAMTAGQEFTVNAQDGTVLNCTVEEDTTVAQTAVEIGHNNFDNFECREAVP